MTFTEPVHLFLFLTSHFRFVVAKQMEGEKNEASKFKGMSNMAHRVLTTKNEDRKFKGMSTMVALLKYGRDHNLSKKRGWLKRLLISEGLFLAFL